MDDVNNYYNAYAEKRGYGVCRGVVKKSRTPPHPIIYQGYVCDKEGVKNTTDKRHKGLLINCHPDSRVSCPAAIRIILTSLKRWRVSRFFNGHPHKFTRPDKAHNHYSHRTHRSKLAGPLCAI